MSTTKTLILSDGRKLAWEEAGKPDGVPIIYFHGSPGSKLQRRVFINEEYLINSNIKMITPDRPGIGFSDFEINRKIESCEKDISALVENLNLNKFAVLGFSGGTPYALTIASSQLPVRAVGIVSGDAPYHSLPEVPEGLPNTAERHPLLTKLTLYFIRFMAKMAPGITINRGTAMLSEADQKVVADPLIRKRFLFMLKDSLRQGPDGLLKDLQLARQHWNVDSLNKRAPVEVWHGEADADSPISIAEYFKEKIPRTNLHTYPGEGHVSVFVNHAKEILQTLAKDLQAA